MFNARFHARTLVPQKVVPHPSVTLVVHMFTYIVLRSGLPTNSSRSGVLGAGLDISPEQVRIHVHPEARFDRCREMGRCFAITFQSRELDTCQMTFPRMAPMEC